MSKRSSVIFHAYASAHNKLESVGSTFSSSESKMASFKEGEHQGRSQGGAEGAAAPPPPPFVNREV